MLYSDEEWAATQPTLPKVWPYMDPNLQQNPKLCCRFVAELYDAGIVRFTQDPLEFASFFFRQKEERRPKDGHWRPQGKPAL